MATYTVEGHPLNYADLGVSGTEGETLKVALMNTGVGQTISITLSGAHDTKVKGYKVLK